MHQERKSAAVVRVTTVERARLNVMVSIHVWRAQLQSEARLPLWLDRL